MTSITAVPPTDLVFSFDTTGSMYPALTQVRRRVRETAARLFRDIPGIRIGVTAHGDYCDAGRTYVTRHLPLSSQADVVSRFVETVEATGGGDAPECYELVLHEARGFAWRPEATKVLVLIGDDVPHPPAQNPRRLNWRDEVQALAEMGVVTYGVQALGRRHATPFYQELARISGGYHLSLDQFNMVTDLLMGICYRQAGEEQLSQYASEVQGAGRMSRALAQAFSTMSGRVAVTIEPIVGTGDLRAVHPSRFQVLDVDRECSIREFVEGQGLTFRAGRGFYFSVFGSARASLLAAGVKHVSWCGDATNCPCCGILQTPEHVSQSICAPSRKRIVSGCCRPLTRRPYFSSGRGRGGGCGTTPWPVGGRTTARQARA